MWQNDYIRIPFLDKGRTEKGADCWGLVRLIYQRQRGIELPDYSECYSNTKDVNAITPHIMDVKVKHWHDVATPQEFDLIILKYKGFPWHVGVVITPKKMIHCGYGVGTAIADFPSKTWPVNKIVGFARYGAASGAGKQG